MLPHKSNDSLTHKPDWETLRRLGNFQLAAQIIVEGLYSGAHRSPFYDASAEFADYRPYSAGDSIRSIDWRAYARTDRDYVRLFRKETEMSGCLVLDTSRSMDYRDPTQSLPKRKLSAIGKPLAPTKAEYARYLFAALAYLMVRQGDRVSLALGGSRLKTFLPPAGSRTHLQTVLNLLEQTVSDGTTDLAQILREVSPLLKRNGVLILASDLLSDNETLFASLARFTHRGFRVLLLHILTPSELDLSGVSGVVRVTDSETDAILDADTDAIKSHYLASIGAWLSHWETVCKSRGITYVRLTTDTPFEQALRAFLTVKVR